MQQTVHQVKDWTMHTNKCSSCIQKRGIKQEIKVFHKADKARKVWEQVVRYLGSQATVWPQTSSGVKGQIPVSEQSASERLSNSQKGHGLRWTSALRYRKTSRILVLESKQKVRVKLAARVINVILSPRELCWSLFRMRSETVLGQWLSNFFFF